MVGVSAEAMDVVFKALADPTRRLLLDRLREQNGQTLSQVCEPLGMARQSATQHLDVLVRANLVTVVRRGRCARWKAVQSTGHPEVHNVPTGPGTPGHRAGLAVEPMTCAPDAFNDDAYDFDTGVVSRGPGESHEAGWTISAR